MVYTTRIYSFFFIALLFPFLHYCADPTMHNLDDTTTPLWRLHNDYKTTVQKGGSVFNVLYEAIEEEVSELIATHTKTPADTKEVLDSFAAIDTLLSTTEACIFEQPGASIVCRPLTPLRTKIQDEWHVRTMLLAPPIDYALLLEKAQYTQYALAHTAACDYLKQSPPSDTYDDYMGVYFSLLDTKTQALYFKSFLKRALGLPQSDHGAHIFYTLTTVAIADEIPHALEEIAATVCKEPYNIPGIYKLGVPGTSVYTAFSNASPTTDTIALAQCFMHMQNDHTQLASLLTKRPSIIQQFCNGIEQSMEYAAAQHTKPLTKAPYWQQVATNLICSILYNTGFKASRAELCKHILSYCKTNPHIAQKFNAAAGGSSWFDFLLIRSEFHTLEEVHKHNQSYVQKHNTLLQKLCELDTKTYTQEQVQKVDGMIQLLQELLYSRNSPTQNNKMIQMLCKRGFTSIFDHIINTWNCDKNISLEQLANFIPWLSGAHCHAISNIYSNASIIEEVQKWTECGARKGHEKCVEMVFLKSILHDRLVEHASLFKDACRAHPKSFQNTLYRDLCYMNAIGDNKLQALPLADGVSLFFTDFFARNKIDTPCPNTVLTRCYTYAWISAKILFHQLYEGPIDHDDIVSLLKKAHKTPNSFNPSAITPHRITSYYQSRIDTLCAQTPATSKLKEDVGILTLHLDECSSYSDDPSILESRTRGMAYALGIITPDSRQQQRIAQFFKKDHCTDLKPLVLSVLAQQNTLDNFCAYVPIPLESLTTEHTRLEEAASVRDLFLQSPLYIQLQNICSLDPSTSTSLDVIRFMIRSSIYKDGEEKRNLLKKLCVTYKDTDTKKYDEAHALLAKHIKITYQNNLAKQHMQEHCDTVNYGITLYNKLKQNIPPTEEDHQQLESLIKAHQTLSMLHVLKADLHAASPCHKANSHTAPPITLTLIALEQARTIEAQQDPLSHPWLKYVTPTLQDYLWEHVRTQQLDTEMQETLTLRSYACLINGKKELSERMQLLKPGILRHALSSLLYAQALTEDGTKLPLHIENISTRMEIYKLMHYALTQGQRSAEGATTIDGTTCIQARSLLEKWTEASDVIATFTCISINPDSANHIRALYDTPFEQYNKSSIRWDLHSNDLITYAGSHPIIKTIGTEAQRNDSHAQAAYFRLFLPKVASMLSSKADFTRNIRLIEDTLSYSLPYLKLRHLHECTFIQKAVISLIEKALSYQAKNQGLKKIKTELEKLKKA